VFTVKELLRKAIGKGKFVLPRQVVMLGSIEASIPGRVDGVVTGDVKTEGMLVIGRQASIRGNVYATDLISYGKIYGDIYITHKAVINNIAYVKGDVNAVILEVKEGAVIEGAIRKNIPPVKPDARSESEADEQSEGREKAVPKNEEERISNWF
jgi:cytoskeletal protein CcmA (bactofilin family)